MQSEDLGPKILELAKKADSLEDFYARSFALILDQFQCRSGVLMSIEDDLLVLKVARGASPGIWRMESEKNNDSSLGRIAQREKPQIVEDLSSLSLSRYFKDFRSAGVIPILSRGYLLGIIVIFSKEKESFLRIDLSELESAAETMGVVSRSFQDNGLERENQKQKEEINILGEMLKKLSHSLDHEEMLTSFLSASAEITKADMAALATYNKKEDALIVHPWTHNISQIKSSALNFSHDEKIGGAAFCKGSPQVLNSLDDEHQRHFRDRGLDNVKSMVAIPLKTRSQSVGVAYLLSEKENNFQNIDFSILEKMASLISAALSHSEVSRILAEEKEKSVKTSESFAKEKEKRSLLGRLEKGFSGLVGEELKTPIIGIKNFLEMILSGETGKIDTATRQVIKETKLATHRLNNLVENIISSQELEKGNFSLKPKKIDLHLLIKEISDIYQKKIEEKKLLFSTNIKTSLWVKCDPEKTKQIISNLLDNALKFTKNGQIKILAKNIGNFIEIEIYDTGIGIPAEHRKNLFSKFYRSQTPESYKIPGSGLGLWVTRGLVEAQGGKVSVSSRRGEGSKFNFTLPRVS